MPRHKAARRFWAWLALATGLMLAGLALLMGIFLRQARLAETSAQMQADSVTALVFQFEREFLRLRAALERIDAKSPPDWDALALRHDIFLSRLSLLTTSPSVEPLRERSEYQIAIPEILLLAERLAPLMTRPAAHQPELLALAAELQAIGPDVQSMTLASNSLISHQMQQQINTLRRQSRLIIGLFAAQALLMLLVAVSIVLRQRRQERERQALEHLNREFENARRQAEQANLAKGQFLANMSHELRTPFNGMLGMLQLLHETTLNARQRDYLTTAADSAQHLLTLLNDILDMAAIDEGKLKIKPEAMALKRVLNDVLLPMQAQAEEKGLRFDTQLAPDLPAVIWMDPTRLRQLLFNLLSNAIKFTERGNVHLEVLARPGDAPHLLTLVVKVRDTGIGMSPEAAARLFERFYQIDSSLTRRRGGSGLGLNITRSLVDLMGGQLKLHSVDGQGSEFTLELPSQTRDEADSRFVDTLPPTAPHAAPTPASTPTPDSATATATAAPEPATESEPEVQASGLKVLVVDDHPVNQKLASALLRRMGHEVDQAVNGRQALEKVEQQAYDLVLMDLHMPEMDGLDSTRHIRRLPAPRGRVPVVALTANAMAATEQEALAAGCSGFLTKPLKVQELQAVLARCQASPHRQATD